VGLAALAAIAAVSLVMLTSYLHQITGFLGESVASVRLGGELQVDLLRFSRQSNLAMAGHPTAAARAAEIEQAVRDKLRAMERHAATDSERRLLARVEEAVAAYVEARRTAERVEQDVEDVIRVTDGPLSAALARLDELVRLNHEESRAALDLAGRWDRVANVVGLTVALGLVGGVLGLLAWLGWSVFRPMLLMRAVLRRHASGDLSTRIPELGPSELRDIAQAFNDMAEALSRHEERRFAFLAGVAHDLRTPLNALRLSTAAAEREDSPGRLREMLHLASRQVQRMERMLADLLDRVRIEAGQLELRPEVRDLRDTVREVARLYDGSSERHHLTVALPPDTVLVRCDALRIEQVLGNLISNAIKYSPDGGRVSIALALAAGAAVVSVSDEGVGIPPDARQYIFEPFLRGAHVRDRVEGAGLGLSVARRIVVEHGGAIEVESELQRGSTFTIRLPLASGAPDGTEAAAPTVSRV
jgi:signal transduction histidine kinase